MEGDCPVKTTEASPFEGNENPEVLSQTAKENIAVRVRLCLFAKVC